MHLIEVDDDSKTVTEAKHDDHKDEHDGNIDISLVPGWGVDTIGQTGLTDFFEQQIIESWEEQEGEKCHDHEIGD